MDLGLSWMGGLCCGPMKEGTSCCHRMTALAPPVLARARGPFCCSLASSRPRVCRGHVHGFSLDILFSPERCPSLLPRPTPPSRMLSPLPAGGGGRTLHSGVSDFSLRKLQAYPPPLSSFAPSPGYSVCHIAGKHDLIIELLAFPDTAHCGSLPQAPSLLLHLMLHVLGLMLKEGSGAERMSLCFLWPLGARGLGGRELRVFPSSPGSSPPHPSGARSFPSRFAEPASIRHRHRLCPVEAAAERVPDGRSRADPSCGGPRYSREPRPPTRAAPQRGLRWV